MNDNTDTSLFPKTNTPIPETQGKPFFKMVRLILPLLLLFIAYSCCFILPANQTGFIMRVGEVNEVLTTPGLYFKMPWPIDQAVIFDQHHQIYESPLTELQTQDASMLLARVFVTWKVSDPVLFHERCGKISDMQLKLFSLTQDQMRVRFAEYTFNQVFSQEGFNALQDALVNTLKVEAQKLYAIEVVSAGIDRLTLPSRVIKSVLERQNAEYEQQAAQARAVAEKQANEIEQKAIIQRAQLLADAERQAGEIRAEAEKEVLKHQEVFASNPELADFLQKLKATETILKEKTTLVITPGTPPFDIFSDSYMVKGK